MERSISTLTGPKRKLDGGILFGHTPRLRWAHWMRPDHDNLVDIASRGLLVQQDGKNILVLSGAGCILARHTSSCRCHTNVSGLLHDLARLHLSEKDIHAVVLTHLHVQDSTELREGLNDGVMPRLLFPNASYIISASHWHRASHPHPRDRDLFVAPLIRCLDRSGRVTLVDGTSCQQLGTGWYLHYSDGHTPGQLLPEILLPGGPVLFVGDLIPGTHWLSLEINSAYNRNPEYMVAEKERLLDHMVENRGRLFFSIDPDVAMVKVIRDRKSRYIAFDHYKNFSKFDS